MKVKNTIKTHLSQSFTSSSHHLHEDEDFMDIDEDQDDKVDDEDREPREVGEKESEGDERDENEEDLEPSEEEEIDKEADKRYWEAKAKEGVHKVCLRSQKQITSDNIFKHSQ